jgi:hypothetical protein
MNPQETNEWLSEHWPNARVVDKNWTMERYDYPQEVRDWIKTNWIKINDNNGGTWSEPEYYHMKQEEQKKRKEQERKHHAVENPEEDNGQSFAQNYEKSGLSKGMDELNKKALDVMATGGMDAAVKHMFTDQETGRQLSYGEMRMRYG